MQPCSSEGKAEPHPVECRHQSLAPESLHKPWDQTQPPGGRQQKQEKLLPCSWQKGDHKQEIRQENPKQANKTKLGWDNREICYRWRSKVKNSLIPLSVFFISVIVLLITVCWFFSSSTSLCLIFVSLINMCLGMFLLRFFLYLENSAMATGLGKFTRERSTRLYVVTLLI